MMATRVPGWLERVLLPQLNEMKGGVKALDARVGGFDDKVEGEFMAVHSQIKRLDEKIDSNSKRLEEKIDSLDKRMDMAQRIAVIEEKMRELESKH